MKDISVITSSFSKNSISLLSLPMEMCSLFASLFYYSDESQSPVPA